MDVSTNWFNLHQDVGKTYSEIRNIKDEIILEVFKSKHLQAYEKESWRLSGYKRKIREDHHNYLFDKRELPYGKPSACKNRWEIFCVKRLMAKQAFRHPFARRQFVELCKRLAWNGLMFKGKESWPKMIWNWDLSLLKKFVVNMQCATVKYQIIRKPMVLGRVEVSSLKFSH